MFISCEVHHLRAIEKFERGIDESSVSTKDKIRYSIQQRASYLLWERHECGWEV